MRQPAPITPAELGYSAPQKDVREADEEHEIQVRIELDLCLAASAIGQREAAQRHWKKFVSLVEQRSADQVKRMEEDRGLA